MKRRAIGTRNVERRNKMKFAHGEEEEQSLLLAHGVIQNCTPSPSPIPATATHHMVHIKEQKV
jgi:hypothetical protein